MVRNMEPLMAPFGNNPLIEGLRNVLRAHVAKRSVRHSTRVVAVSEFVRSSVISKWRVDPAKISVVYHGVDERVTVAVSPRALDGRDPGAFVYCAGSLRPYRGIEDAIRALPRLRAWRPDFSLLVAGVVDGPTASYKTHLLKLADNLGVADAVIWLGHVNAQEMAWCFRKALAFLMTSRIEACPNVALEALAHGALCVSTDRQPMPEFFSDVASYYSPGDVEALVRHVRELADLTVTERSQRKGAAASQAQRFDWLTTAAQTVDVLIAATGVSPPHVYTRYQRVPR
jgi:glycosyltransferase involved in cell wall biosynthesis